MLRELTLSLCGVQVGLTWSRGADVGGPVRKLCRSLARGVSDRDHIELYNFAPEAYHALIGRSFFVARMTQLELDSRVASCTKCGSKVTHKLRGERCAAATYIGGA
jgi:DNA-directed RNA polymerase subunit RPC12/RpoP